MVQISVNGNREVKIVSIIAISFQENDLKAVSEQICDCVGPRTTTCANQSWITITYI